MGQIQLENGDIHSSAFNNDPVCRGPTQAIGTGVGRFGPLLSPAPACGRDVEVLRCGREMKTSLGLAVRVCLQYGDPVHDICGEAVDLLLAAGRQFPVYRIHHV